LTTSMKEKMVEERQKHCELQKTYVEFAKRRRSGEATSNQWLSKLGQFSQN